ncbi:MAG: TIGR03986 family CRISPR-associated RAMP protein [Eubacteriales bacterium]|nr:TIGR03986 family CRISPR-associated RAMP protein [Eubacteriales bacterium]
MGDDKIKEDFNYRFVNPYNFIPLGEKCRRKQPDIKDEDCYTGYFDCGMRLLTPLFIPNTSSSARLLEEKEWDENKEEFKGYDFFSYDDWSNEKPYLNTPPLPPSNPVIPGSEIRGPVRSVYEAAFNGCMSSVDGGRDLSRRCGEVKIPGILYFDKEKDGWYLKECKKARLRVEQNDGENVNRQVSRKIYDNWKEGQEIWFCIGKNNLVTKHTVNITKEKRESNPNFRKGYLHKGEYIDRKHCETIFYEIEGKTNNEPIKVCDEDVDLLKKVLENYRDKAKNCKVQTEGWYKEFELLEDGSYILVYYAKDNKNRVYMCPACIGREAFKKTVEDLLRNNGGYQPCNNEYLCPACQVFGMLDKTEKPETYAYGSKIRITDATLIHPVKDSSILFEKPIVLSELGEPRPSAVEFYTESPYRSNEIFDEDNMQGYWTYDYKYKYRNGKKNSKERIALNKSYPRIRGRKYYWHSDVDLDSFKGNKVSPMQQRIRPLKPDIEIGSEPKFHFRVYFEQLDKKQLLQLKWALDLGSSDCAHKIGRGKPLGFGSVQIIVDGLHIREIDENTGGWSIITIGTRDGISYKEFFGVNGFIDDEIPNELKIMSNWKERPMKVMYPLGEDKSAKGEEKENARASHQWFRLNKSKYDNFNYNFLKVLPDADDDRDNELDQEKALYKLIKKK